MDTYLSIREFTFSAKGILGKIKIPTDIWINSFYMQVLFARLASYSELGKFLPDDHAKFAPESSSEMGLLEAKKSLTLVTQAPAS